MSVLWWEEEEEGCCMMWEKSGVAADACAVAVKVRLGTNELKDNRIEDHRRSSLSAPE